MFESVTKSVAQEEQGQKVEKRNAREHVGGFMIFATAVAVLAVLGGAVLFAQGQGSNQGNNQGNNNDKYSLISPGGIAFADFRGYEDWSVVSTARTDEVLKVIVGNPAMIKAYKSGIPGNGQSFPDGSMVVKLQWKPKKSTEAQFAVDVPDVFSQAFVMEKDSKRFPKTGGWGYAVFNYEPVSDEFTPDPKSLSDCGNTCHLVVKAKDYIFHPYQKR
jgi:Cytochrome P460